MDATYKTTKYSLPLFFLCVHTNIGYKVVAEFICQYESTVCVSEALGIIKSWNTGWQPKYWMTDYSVVEFNTIEEQFPASLVYICDFHRLESRQRWLRKSKHCLSQQEEDVIMRRLKEVAGAKTEDLFNVAVKELLGTPLVKQNVDVCTYIEKMWLSCSFRWARAFRKHVVDNIVNTNNGVEAQNRVIKYSYLPHTIDNHAC